MSASDLHGQTETRIDPDEYTRDYYLKSCEGFERYVAGGRDLSPRLARALELAAVQPGHRLLDIACGRGEVVLNAAWRGAFAVGIDYAEAATALARRLVERGVKDTSVRAEVSRMDATRLALSDRSFDTVLMLDFVEHVYPHELDRVLDEVLRILRPGGQVIIHTSPNRLFEGVMYVHYVRHVHRAVLSVAERLDVKDRLINRLMLPTGPEPPCDEYERRLHINKHTPDGLRHLLETRGFSSLKVSFWEPPSAPLYNDIRHLVELHVLDFVRFFRPFSRSWPLDRFFSNHIWITARRPA